MLFIKKILLILPPVKKSTLLKRTYPISQSDRECDAYKFIIKKFNTKELLEHDINLSELGPLLNGPFTPDLSTAVGSIMGEKAKANDWPLKVEWGLIGSCTNSSYEDLSRASSIAQQALDKGVKMKSELGINPGSEQVRFTAERDGIIQIFENLDAKIFTNACGPCIGQWARYDDPKNAPKKLSQIIKFL